MKLYSFNKKCGKEIIKFDILDNASIISQIKSFLSQYSFYSPALDIIYDQGNIKLAGEINDQASLEKTVLALGNLVGIEQVDVSEVTLINNNVSSKVTRLYEVKKPDSMWKIAEAVYGPTHGDKYKIIFEANKPLINEADDIFAGQILRIPNIDMVK